jgi:hypothetical protein
MGLFNKSGKSAAELAIGSNPELLAVSPLACVPVPPFTITYAPEGIASESEIMVSNKTFHLALLDTPCATFLIRLGRI